MMRFISYIIAFVLVLVVAGFSKQFSTISTKENLYNKLTSRSDKIEVVYTYQNHSNKTDLHDIKASPFNFSCKVLLTFDTFQWVSVERLVLSDKFNHNPILNCLSKASAQQALTQSYLQFGRGL